MSRDPKVLTSVSVTSRVEVVELMAALRMIQKCGTVPQTRSELVSLCVKTVASALPQNEWPDFVDALYELDSRYPVKTRRGTNIITKQSSDRRAAFLRRAEFEYNMRYGFSRGENYLRTPGGQKNLEESISEEPNSEAPTMGREQPLGQLPRVGASMSRQDRGFKEIEKEGRTYIVCDNRLICDREKARWEGHPDLESDRVRIVTQEEWDGVPEKPRFVIPPELLAKAKEDERRVREAEAGSENQPEEAHK